MGLSEAGWGWGHIRVLWLPLLPLEGRQQCQEEGGDGPGPLCFDQSCQCLFFSGHMEQGERESCHRLVKLQELQKAGWKVEWGQEAAEDSGARMLNKKQQRLRRA